MNLDKLLSSTLFWVILIISGVVAAALIAFAYIGIPGVNRLVTDKKSYATTATLNWRLGGTHNGDSVAISTVDSSGNSLNFTPPIKATGSLTKGSFTVGSNIATGALKLTATTTPAAGGANVIQQPQ